MIVVGLAIAAAIGVLGVSNLARASDEHAASRAQLIAATLAARLSWLSRDERIEMMQRAARKDRRRDCLGPSEGSIVIDASLGLPNRTALERIIAQGTGETTTGLGRVRFATARLETLALVAFGCAFQSRVVENSLRRRMSPGLIDHWFRPPGEDGRKSLGARFAEHFGHASHDELRKLLHERFDNMDVPWKTVTAVMKINRDQPVILSPP